jgi:uncharacterized protein (UPF0548 family)
VFQLTRPTQGQIDAFLVAQRAAEFSYAEIGGTRYSTAPAGYGVDQNRVHLGAGEAVFRRATAALRGWQMTALGWTSVHPARAPVTPGQTVAIVVRHYGFWSMNACRIVYVLDEDAGKAHRMGFAYGTLREHGEIGEERFAVEWLRADDSVWYDLYAFSRPGHLLTRLGYPLGRRMQRRFARESLQTMVSAVNEAVPVSRTESLQLPSARSR